MTQTIADLLANGATPDELVALVRQQAEANNRAVRTTLAAPPPMPDSDWQARKVWLLDGQQVFGELKNYAWPALKALKSDNQEEFSAQRDLLFKVVYTMIGDPPPEPVTEPVAEPVAEPVTEPETNPA